MRYAANRPDAAARERFPSRAITEADGPLWLVALHGRPLSLHLTRQVNLDALALDDRINTGRLDRPGPGGDPLLGTCQALADAVYDWWDGKPPVVVYRSRTTPSARSIAFTEATDWSDRGARPLRDATQLLAALVTRHGFSVPGRWLD